MEQALPEEDRVKPELFWSIRANEPGGSKIPLTLPIKLVRVDANSGIAATGNHTGVIAACVPAVKEPSPRVVKSCCNMASQTPKLAGATTADEEILHCTLTSMNWSRPVALAKGVTDDRTLSPVIIEFRSLPLNAATQP